MNSTLKDQLQQWKRKNKVVEGRKTKAPKKPQKRAEPLSEWELRDLMGVNMQTLKRGRGGAYKR